MRPATVVAHCAVLVAAVFVGWVTGGAFATGCGSIESMMMWHPLIHTAATLVGAGILAGLLLGLRSIQKRRRA